MEQSAEASPSREPSPWRFILLVWISSRLFFLIVGAIGAATLTNADHFFAPRTPVPGHLSYWAHWDGGWYESIARSGYDDTTSTAWFPFYPLALRAGTIIGYPPAISGMLVSLGSFLAALYFFYALARDLLDERRARMATIALAFFPTALFFNAVYTESLFLALSTGAIWAARIRRNVLLAVVLGYFTTITRNYGVFIVIPLAYELMRNDEGELDWRRLAPVLTIPCALAAYMLYLYRVSDDPLLFSTVQPQISQRTLKLPTTTISDALSAAFQDRHYLFHPLSVLHGVDPMPSFSVANPYGLGFLILALALVGAGFVALPRSLWAYSAVLVAIPLFSSSPAGPTQGFPRFLLSAFPLFFVLGSFVAESRVRAAVWLACSAGLGAYFTLLFVSWRWVS